MTAVDSTSIEVGDRIGSRTVIRQATPGTKGRKRFAVRCDCGKESIVNAYHLNQYRERGSGGRCAGCPLGRKEGSND